MIDFSAKGLARFACGVAAFGAAAGLALVAPGEAQAQNWPERGITVVVAAGAGGGTDRQTRVMARHLEEKLGVSVTVQNVGGGGGQVGALTVMREEPDGYTILSTNQPDHSMTIALANAPYSEADWAVLAVDIYDPRLIIVAKDSPYQSWADFVAAAKAAPGTLSVSSVAGGAQDLFGRWIMDLYGLDVNAVGYPSGGEAGTALLGGHVTANIGDDFSRLNMRDDVRGLLLGSPVASPRWPEATLLKDALAADGLTAPTDDFLARYHVYMVPAAMRANNPEAFAKLQEAIVSIAELPEYKQFLAEGGVEDLSIMRPGEDFADNFARLGEALKDLGRLR